MCGITGIYGNLPLERIYPMNHLVEHRGPDDEGFWTDAPNGVALGHRRLSIIDLSPDGRQPNQLRPLAECVQNQLRYCRISLYRRSSAARRVRKRYVRR